ncbi:exo-alpha-sialidase [Pontixanthobacter sp. CEM42]|uniref:exo-alpha-sialidase n=1 Tax=Pontixanthobacter sp. CEM42 TaxID=2792077 RepID=UPI001ADF1DB5|nr:exo-alpha-sialidase [Pontixanthobacter sp. CEM42]
MPEQAKRSIWALLFRIALIAALLLAALVGWYVTGPASAVPYINRDGVPESAWPELTATTVQDLPLSCSFVARDITDPETGKRPHRNHTYLAKHDGQYFIMFSYWYGAEDKPGQVIRYAISDDGMAWSEPKLLASPKEGHGLVARGFAQRDGKLFGQYATHDGKGVFQDIQEETGNSLAMIEAEWLGAENGWGPERAMLDGYINNYPARTFDGQLAMGLRDRFRQTYLGTSDDDGQTWQISARMPVPDLPDDGEQGLVLPDEPIIADYADGEATVMLRNNSPWDGRLWAANLGADDAWSQPYPLAFPSDTSKFFPFKLAGGTTAMVGNFDPTVRRALMHIALSDDGKNYDRLYRLALDGQYGNFRWRSPQYPHVIVDGDTMLLGASYGKYAITVCKAPATAAALEEQSEFKLVPRLAQGICSKNHPQFLRRLFGYMGCVEHFVWG